MCEGRNENAPPGRRRGAVIRDQKYRRRPARDRRGRVRRRGSHGPDGGGSVFDGTPWQGATRTTAAGDSGWPLSDLTGGRGVRGGRFGVRHTAYRQWLDAPEGARPDLRRSDAGPAYMAPGVIRIELDPGLAFGTGSHPTTHLCLAWLETDMPAGATLLDYGCGSGILAIAARKLGAGATLAVDIDPQAVQSTVDNAAVNRVELSAMLPDGLPEGGFQVVVANILSNPLKVLAPMLAARVAPGGHLVLSGVLERQAEEVAAAYAPWIAMSVWRAREGWVCLHGQRV